MPHALYSGPVWLVPGLPLAGAAVLLLTGRRWKGASAGWLGCLTVLGSFATTVFLFLHFTGQNGPHPYGLPSGVRTPEGHLPLVDQLYQWIASGTFRVDVAFRVDQLSLVMALTVTGVGFLIHVYSIGYMDGDPRLARFRSEEHTSE